jgi:chromosome segregation ATPase
MIASGQSESSQPEPSLSVTLQTLSELSTTLVGRLSERESQIADLRDNLTKLTQELQASRDESAVLQMQLMALLDERKHFAMAWQEMSNSLQKSKAELVMLDDSFRTYQKEMSDQVKSLQGERDAWEIGAFVAGAVAVIVAGAWGLSTIF